MLMELRFAIMNRLGAGGLHVLGNILGDMADNGSGQMPIVTFPVLEAGLGQLGLQLNPQDLEEILMAAGCDSTGSVPVDGLLHAFRGPVSPHREALIQDVFTMIDQGKQGSVSIDDLAACFDGNGFPDVMAGQVPAQEALNYFLGQLDGPRRHGGVTRDEFVEYFRNVSTALPDDGLFLQMMQQLWRLS